MAKFIEVTNSHDNTKRLISIDRIISIIESPDKTAFIEFYPPNKKGICGMDCAERYIDIYNELIACECILFGSGV